jgi:hypothetical protein
MILRSLICFLLYDFWNSSQQICQDKAILEHKLVEKIDPNKYGSSPFCSSPSTLLTGMIHISGKNTQVTSNINGSLRLV